MNMSELHIAVSNNDRNISTDSQGMGFLPDEFLDVLDVVPVVEEENDDE